ncbi:lig_chan-Glu_bd domain-containing protein [Trichonephila clavata]|uniref:Lig_chan-Glu_bd domain-containing protein n=1 Tax=Trichonephila clavata TaxID=2740835 RepID=A0A8X6HSF0_TRICU|nr:lig_chan-Glu_bd domain-containing protein [Trichonephila clavata]
MKILPFPSKIKVAMVQLKNVFTAEKVNGKYVLDGLEGKLFKCLAEKLNFEFEIVESPNGQYGSSNNNGTWDGVIGLVQSGNADMGFGALSISEKRLEVVDFSNAYIVLQKSFVTKEPSQMPKITAFIYPFTLNVWILYTLIILATTVLFQRIMFRNSTLLGSFLSMLGSISSQAVENVRDTPWRRILFGLWLTIASVMTFLYNINFLSFLTMPEKVPVPKSFEELSKMVLSGKYKCLTPIGTIDRDLLRGSGIDYMVKLGEAIEKNDWKYSFTDNIADLLDGSAAIIIPRISLKFLLGSPPYVRVKMSDENFGIWNAGIALKKGFCCSERLNDVLYGIINGGLYEKWTEEHAFAISLHKRSELQHEETELQLTLQDLKLPFFVLFIGYAFAFGVFLLEVLSPKRLDIFYS